MSVIVLIAAIALSDVTVTIDAAGTPVSDALFNLYDYDRPQNAPWQRTTKADGIVIVSRSPARGGVVVKADGFLRYSDDWPLTVSENDIHMRKPRLTKFSVAGQCVEIVPITTMRAVDGERVVSETRYGVVYMPCTDVADRVQLKLPTTPPPVGYRYQLQWVDSWYDAKNRRIGHRPYYRIVPANIVTYEPAYHCGCQ